ncbi:MAG: hypothetical protein ACI4S3_03540 [Candidatus Gastranaerophilaceae bacterium]
METKKKGIKSGTLRRKYNDALKEKVVCRNQILITLAAMDSDIYKDLYTDIDRLSLARIFLDNGYEKEFIQKYISLIKPQVTYEYFPTKDQMDTLLDNITSEYKYEDGYIKDILLRSVNKEDLSLTSRKKYKKKFNAQELKKYIYESEQIEVVLQDLGCGNIVYNDVKQRYECSNPDGDKIGAIHVKDNPYLGVRNFTRKGYNDKADILTLIMNITDYSFADTITYLHGLLELTDKNLLDINLKPRKDKVESIIEKSDFGEEVRILSESELKRDYYYQAMNKSWYLEGITEEVRKKFGILLSCHHVVSKRGTVIPLRHYETGELLGINLRRSMEETSRTALGLQKYHLTKGYKKHLNIYGLYQNNIVAQLSRQKSKIFIMN